MSTANPLSPFPIPTYPRLSSDEARIATTDFARNAADAYVIAEIGRRMAAENAPMLSGQLRLFQRNTQEHAFTPAVLYGLGILSVKNVIPLSNNVVQSHMADLAQYCDADQSFFSAAIRLGNCALEYDPILKECADAVMNQKPFCDQSPEIVYAGFGNSLLLADRALREAAVDNPASIDALDAAYAEELKGILPD